MKDESAKMPDREKVIQGLERCAGTDCTGCPYQGISPCQNKLAEDALALLKDQEARVMTKSEAISYPEKQNAFSDSDKAPLYVEYKKPQPYFVKWVTADSVYLWMKDIELSLDYGKEYRFWTSRPTEEQRKAVAWEPPKGDRHVQDEN